jgi:hypothetical protein
VWLIADVLTACRLRRSMAAPQHITLALSSSSEEASSEDEDAQPAAVNNKAQACAQSVS